MQECRNSALDVCTLLGVVDWHIEKAITQLQEIIDNTDGSLMVDSIVKAALELGKVRALVLEAKCNIRERMQ